MLSLLEAHRDILTDSDRIFYLSNLYIKLSVDKQKGTNASKGRKESYGRLSFCSLVNSKGRKATTAVVCPSTQQRDFLLGNLPEDFFIRSTDSGMLNQQCFEEYLWDAVMPWLTDNCTHTPVVLFMDAESVRVPHDMWEDVRDAGVILCSLPFRHPSNPLLDDVNSLLKATLLVEFQQSQQHIEPVNSAHSFLISVYKEALNKLHQQTIQLSFTNMGLYPFDSIKIFGSNSLESNPNNFTPSASGTSHMKKENCYSESYNGLLTEETIKQEACNAVSTLSCCFNSTIYFRDEYLET